MPTSDTGRRFAASASCLILGRRSDVISTVAGEESLPRGERFTRSSTSGRLAKAASCLHSLPLIQHVGRAVRIEPAPIVTLHTGPEGSVTQCQAGSLVHVLDVGRLNARRNHRGVNTGCGSSRAP